jgi:hypothetical protein
MTTGANYCLHNNLCQKNLNLSILILCLFLRVIKVREKNHFILENLIGRPIGSN